jgi:hypothetical protein
LLPKRTAAYGPLQRGLLPSGSHLQANQSGVWLLVDLPGELSEYRGPEAETLVQFDVTAARRQPTTRRRANPKGLRGIEGIRDL